MTRIPKDRGMQCIILKKKKWIFNLACETIKTYDMKLLNYSKAVVINILISMRFLLTLIHQNISYFYRNLFIIYKHYYIQVYKFIAIHLLIHFKKTYSLWYRIAYIPITDLCDKTEIN